MDTTLRCVGLRKSFNGVCALNIPYLEFSPSGIIAIIGPNGAGKTTLLNVLSGFLRPDSGHCFIGESEITRLAPYKIVRLGIARTFQDVRLIRQEAVLDNVLLAQPRQYGENLIGALLTSWWYLAEQNNRQKTAMDHLRAVNLDGRAKDLAGELSYGQQKLLALTCCIATGARVLLLDEPVAGVAPEMTAKILESLRLLRTHGNSIIFAEHDLNTVRAIADHVIVMDDGAISAAGVPSEVLQQDNVTSAYFE